MFVLSAQISVSIKTSLGMLLIFFRMILQPVSITFYDYGIISFLRLFSDIEKMFCRKRKIIVGLGIVFEAQQNLFEHSQFSSVDRKLFK